MPRVGDCKKGKIYAIRSHQTDEIYIGSTTQELSARISDHRHNFKLWEKDEKKYKYTSSFEIIKHGDAYIELLEYYPCETPDQLNKREGEYIREHKCVNKYVAGRSVSEWHKDNAEYVKQHKREYNERNKEHLARKKKEYREKHIEYFLQIAKEYRTNNKAKIAERDRLYREKNKEHLNQQAREKGAVRVQCECGDFSRKDSISKHRKTKIHKRNMEALPIGLCLMGF